MLHLSLGNAIVRLKTKYWIILEKGLFTSVFTIIAFFIYSHFYFLRHHFISNCINDSLHESQTVGLTPFETYYMSSVTLNQTAYLNLTYYCNTSNQVFLPLPSNSYACEISAENFNYSRIFYWPALNPMRPSRTVWEIVVMVWKCIGLEVGYKLTAELLFDAVIKHSYWTVTVYTIARSTGCIVVFAALLYWARDVHPNIFLAIFSGLCGLLAKFSGELLLLNYWKKVDYYLVDSFTGVLFYIYLICYQNPLCVVLLNLLKLIACVYKLYRKVNQDAWGVLMDAKRELEAQQAEIQPESDEERLLRLFNRSVARRFAYS